jgi:hypothetical protein
MAQQLNFGEVVEWYDVVMIKWIIAHPEKGVKLGTNFYRNIGFD